MASPNMSLNIPVVGVTIGPNWALQINQCLDVIDQHNHASGSGVQITPAGMNINTDLSLGGNNATNARSIRFNPQVSAFTAGTDIGCIYVYGADLYYRDTSSNNVRLTIGGAVAGTPGSIGGLVAPASVTYVPANQTYVFQSNVNTAGAIDCGPLYLRNIVAASNYIQISPPAVLPANYTLTLPSTLPGTTSVVLLDSLGNLSTSGTASALSVTTLNAANVNASSAIAIKNDTGLLQFRNTADSVQFASITGDSSGLTLNLPDTADSYLFKVNNVTKASITNSGVDGQYLYNLSSSQIPTNSTSEIAISYGSSSGAPFTVTFVNTTLSMPANSCILCTLNPTSTNIQAIGTFTVRVTGPAGYSKVHYVFASSATYAASIMVKTQSAGTYAIQVNGDAVNIFGAYQLSLTNVTFLAAQV